MNVVWPILLELLRNGVTAKKRLAKNTSQKCNRAQREISILDLDRGRFQISYIDQYPAPSPTRVRSGGYGAKTELEMSTLPYARAIWRGSTDQDTLESGRQSAQVLALFGVFLDVGIKAGVGVLIY